MDPTKTKEIMAELKQMGLVQKNKRTQQWTMDNQKVFFSALDHCFFSESDSKEHFVSKEVTSSNIMSMKEDMYAGLYKYIEKDDLMKFNIGEILAYIDGLVQQQTPAQAKDKCKELIDKLGGAISTNLVLSFQDKVKMKDEMNKVSEQENIGKIYFTYCQRIQHLYFLIWNTYKERVKLAVQTITQVETICNNSSNVRNSSISNFQKFTKCQPFFGFFEILTLFRWIITLQLAYVTSILRLQSICLSP